MLVNGSPTREFEPQRGLKQGDPLAPFLFLVVAKGLSGLINQAVNTGLFMGFVFGEESVEVSHLQYADDSLLVCQESVQNLWAMKEILRYFELVSGLKVNFLKSNLFGLNISD